MGNLDAVCWVRYEKDDWKKEPRSRKEEKMEPKVNVIMKSNYVYLFFSMKHTADGETIVKKPRTKDLIIIHTILNTARTLKY